MPLSTGNSLFWSAGLDTKALKTGTAQAKGMLASLTKNITAMDVFGGLAIGAGVAFAKISKEAFQFAKEFETAMTEVATISMEVQANYEGMSEAIMDMSTRLPIGAIELTQALYQVISASFDAAEAMDVLNASAQAAIGGLTTTEIAVDGITTVLNAFNMEASEATYVADVLFTTVKKGKTRFDELARSMSLVAPLAAASGVAFEQVMSAVATLTKQGTPTAMAMTQIRQAMISVNESLGDGWTAAYTLQEAFEELWIQSGKSATKLKTDMGRVEGALAVMAMTGEQFKGSMEDLKDYGNVWGAAADAADLMAGTIENRIKEMNNTIKAQMKPLGDWWKEFWLKLLQDTSYQIDMFEHQRASGKFKRDYVPPWRRGPTGPGTGPPEQEPWTMPSPSDAGVWQPWGTGRGQFGAPSIPKTTPTGGAGGAGKSSLFDMLMGQYAGIRPGEGLGARGSFDFKGAENWYSGLVKSYERLGDARKKLKDLEKDADKDRLDGLREFREELFQVSIAIEEAGQFFAMMFGEEAADGIYQIVDSLHKVTAVLDDMGLEKLSDFKLSDMGIGDWMTMINAAIGIIGGLVSALSSADTSWEDAIERFDEMIESQERMISLMMGQEQLDAMRKMAAAYITEIDGIDKRLKEIAREIAPGIWMPMFPQDASEVRDLAQRRKDLAFDLAETEQEIMRMATATWPDTIADAITDGFKQGKMSAKDFAETFEELMSTALITAFKNKIISEQIYGWYEEFAAATEGGLTEEEIAALQKLWTEGFAAMGQSWEDFVNVAEGAGIDITGLGDATRPSLKGAIRGITEQTAGVLAGQFNAIRMNTVEGLQLMEHQVTLLSQISYNTSRNPQMYQALWAIYAKMSSGSGTNYLRAQGA